MCILNADSNHNCLTHKKLHIHVMEVDDNSDSEVEDVVSEELVVSSASEPLISVNALIGTTSFRTMRVTGYYRKTHFISSLTVVVHITFWMHMWQRNRDVELR